MTSRYLSEHDLVVVRAQVVGSTGSRSCKLAVDTGAAFTLLRPERLAAIGAIALPGSVRLGTVGGLADGRRFRLEALSALGIERADMSIVARDLPTGFRIDGLLGLDFLRGTRLTIDFRLGEIELEP